MISQSSRPPEVIWKSRCASCHGEKGQLNKKFVYEYYPLPRILSISRLDSLGMDSLTKVILEGRTFMSAHQGRVSESEAKALVQYMRALALEVP
jgi:cytochrome c5